MRHKVSPLLEFLADNTAVDRLESEDLSLLWAEARACGLLGRVAYTLTNSQQTKAKSTQFENQLLAANIHSHGFMRDVGRELAHIERALSGLQTPVILLKGASYALLGLPTACGRVFSDIDILVAKEQIAHAEAALMLGGWATGRLSAYDHRYYRQWSHEIPPMTHLQRGTTVDLHHSLVMPTCRVRVDSSQMIAAAKPVHAAGFWWRLQDEDMVLHAASHLMLNSEFDRGLRDLWDIDLLFRHFASLDPDFPDRLHARAQEVGLAQVLSQVLWLASHFFTTPLPKTSKLKRSVFLGLVSSAATTRHPDSRPWSQRAADFVLMLREMYLRLPNKLLAIHLWHKLSNPLSLRGEDGWLK